MFLQCVIHTIINIFDSSEIHKTSIWYLDFFIQTNTHTQQTQLQSMSIMEAQHQKKWYNKLQVTSVLPANN